MDRRSNIILRHKETGLYFDRMAEHNKNLWMAWRFPDQEYLAIWFENHSYAPKADEYEPIEIEMTISIRGDMQNETRDKTSPL